MKSRRKVEIVKHAPSHSWLVRYTERQPRTRHTAAQFDCRHSGLDYVRNYVANRPDLELVSIQSKPV